MNIESVPTGALALDLALGIGGPAPGPGVRDLRPGVLGQVHPRHARGGRGPAQRRHLRLHRRRARHGPDLRRRHRRRRRRDAHLPARHGGAGPGDLRHARALRRPRRGGHRLGGGPHPPGRDRGRDGRQPRRPPGPAHVPGPAQAHRQPAQDPDHLHLHQPAAGEDRRHVRLAGDHPRRPGAEVLLVGPARHPPHRVHQGRRRGGGQPHPGQGGQEQGRPAVQAGRVRHHVRQGRQPRGLGPRHRRRPGHRQEVRGLVHLRGRAAGPGPGERQGLPHRQPRGHGRGLRAHPPGDGPRRRGRRRRCPRASRRHERARRRAHLPRRAIPSPPTRTD